MYERLEYYKVKNWLHNIAPTFGIKVGGKTVFELMDEIQCAAQSRTVREQESTKNSVICTTSD
jgi:hypothetical protein